MWFLLFILFAISFFVFITAVNAKNELAAQVQALQDELHRCNTEKEQACKRLNELENRCVEYGNEKAGESGKLSRLNNIINDKEVEIEGLRERLVKCNATKEKVLKKLQSLEDYNKEVALLKNTIQELKAELRPLETQTVIETTDISNYDNISSEECKNQLVLLKNKYNELTKANKIIEVLDNCQPRKMILNNQKQILLCFNAQCANIIDNLTVKNVDASRAKIQRAFDTINNIFAVDGMKLSVKALEMKLEELTLVYAYVVKKEQERQEQKAIREQMLEEEKARKEIEREKLRIEKEEKQFRNEVSKLMKYMQKANDIEKQLYIDKIRELEDKIGLLEKDKENVREREQKTRAGYVYVISNIGSFGEDVYKIGMTRRLEPMDRVKELGDASVPFEFDVHAMIFSDDAPALESVLHQTFKKYQVNKVNDRKEFFKVSLDKIEQVVKENHNATVTFTKVAEAAQYRESLRLSEAVSV